MSSSQSDTGTASLAEALDLRVLPGRDLKPRQFLQLRNSALAGMLRIFRDSLNRPIGYVGWAMINRASLDRLVRSGRIPTYPYEWNEGGFCLLLDVLIVDYGRREALRGLRQFVRSQRAVVYAKRTPNVRVLLRRGGRLRAWTDHRSAMSLAAVSEDKRVTLPAGPSTRRSIHS